MVNAVTRWYCPNCKLEDITTEARPHSRFHTCAKQAGLSAPFVHQGTKAKVERHEREDYVGDEHVQTDGNGRPVMSITTTRDEGQDTMVFAPTANGRIT
jgi:hypothetical protein